MDYLIVKVLAWLLLTLSHTSIASDNVDSDVTVLQRFLAALSQVETSKTVEAGREARKETSSELENTLRESNVRDDLGTRTVRVCCDDAAEDQLTRRSGLEEEAFIRRALTDLSNDLLPGGANLNMKSREEKRIIGGEEVEEGDWPWLVSLKGEVPSGGFFSWFRPKHTLYCGASLLNARWILTAAHCFVNSDLPKAAKAKYWHARMGEEDLEARWYEKIISLFAEVFKVKDHILWEVHGQKIIVHPEYSDNAGDMWKNDLALMKLEEDVPHTAGDTSDIQAVTLTPQGDYAFPATGQMCVMKGWGCTHAGGNVANVAKAVLIPAVDPGYCSAIYGVDKATRLCAGYNLGAMGICPGDSGGPLVCLRNGTYEQVGVASFTAADAPQDYPGAFTRVAHYTDWIWRTINSN